MTEVTLFSYITKEEQERMRVCFRMREASFQNTETIMEYSSSMKKIGLILDGQASVYCCDEEGKQFLLDELKKDGRFWRTLSPPGRISALLCLRKIKNARTLYRLRACGQAL